MNSIEPTFLGYSQRLPPSNLQAEQALLGALLANNRAYERVAEFLVADHFADAIHGRIYQAIARRIEAGQLDLHERQFALRTVAAEIERMYAPVALGKGLGFRVTVKPSVPYALFGDATRWRQVLGVFVDNALKFTKSGGVIVTIDAQPVEGGISLLRADVKDTGIGIAASDLPLLFRSFSQVDASSTRRHGGTGAGLAIAERLSRMMGGEVGVESTVGEGSRFWFTARMKISALDTPMTAGAGAPHMALVENPDILSTVAHLKSKRPPLVIGFAAETEKVVEHAKAKLARKGCDWILANDVSPATGTFGGDRNTVHLVSAAGVDEAAVRLLPGLTLGSDVRVGQSIRATQRVDVRTESRIDPRSVQQLRMGRETFAQLEAAHVPVGEQRRHRRVARVGHRLRHLRLTRARPHTREGGQQRRQEQQEVHGAGHRVRKRARQPLFVPAVRPYGRCQTIRRVIVIATGRPKRSRAGA